MMQLSDNLAPIFNYNGKKIIVFENTPPPELNFFLNELYDFFKRDVFALVYIDQKKYTIYQLNLFPSPHLEKQLKDTIKKYLTK